MKKFVSCHAIAVIAALLLLSFAHTPASADVLVSGEGSGDIERFDQTTGQFLGEFVSPAQANAAGLSSPDGMRYGPDGNLYVSSLGSNQVLEFNGKTGAFVKVFAQGPQLNSPTDLRFGPDGNLYVANLAGNSVAVFNAQTGQPVVTPAGNGIFATGGNLSSPTSLSFGPDGASTLAISATAKSCATT